VAGEEDQVNDMMKRVEVLRDAGEVKRLHTVDTISSHTIARHVYGSQIIAVELCRLNDHPTGPVLLQLLVHDAPEIDTGDIPAPTKRASPEINQALESMESAFYSSYMISLPFMTKVGHDIVKASDTLDLAFAALYEQRRGNRHPRIRMVFYNCMKYLEDQAYLIGIKEFKEYLAMEFRHASL
jgi:5'-deoxynucleotidase YfbR-like HD superfamily hydrolase